MTTSQRFANYPKPLEGPKTGLNYTENKNPALRGWTLVLGTNLVTRLPALAQFMWKNGKLGIAREISALDAYDWRVDPTVIPLASDGNAPKKPELTAQLSERQPENLRGRFYSAADYHELFKSGETTPLRVFEALLPLISRGSKPPAKYDTAWAVVKESLAREAAIASTERYKQGKPLSVLDGVPFGVKDDIKVKDYISHFGMAHAPNNQFFEPDTETQWPIAQLEAAGAIMVGKLVMHECGADTSGCNPRWGTPTNWCNPAYYPGGSSSGAGSALCAGLVPIAVGTDASGSIRIPSASCGVYGLKPTHHRVCTMKSSICVVGPLASTVADLTLAYRIMATPNPEDSTQGSFAPSIPPNPTAKKIIGICQSWFNLAMPKVLDITKKALAHFEQKLGYEIVDIEIPYTEEGAYSHFGWALTELNGHVLDSALDRADPLAGVNLVNRAILTAGACSTGTDMLRYSQMRDLHMRHLAFLYQKYPSLLIVTPTTAIDGWKRHPGDDAYGFSDANVSAKSMKYVWLANATGCPAVTVPVGYSDPGQGSGKLPIGLMAMGEWGAEEQLLSWAKEAEDYLNGVWDTGRIRPQEWFDLVAAAKDPRTEAK